MRASISCSAKRLDHVVVGAAVEAGEFLVERIACGQHQHRSVPVRFGAQTLADLKSVHARQGQVENDHVERLAHRHVQAANAVGGEVDDVTAVGKIVAEVGGKVGIVFDDEDVHGRRIGVWRRNPEEAHQRKSPRRF